MNYLTRVRNILEDYLEDELETLDHVVIDNCTEYLKLKSADMPHSIMKGIDAFGRKFVALKLLEEDTIDNETFEECSVIFERYSQNSKAIVCSGLDLFDSTLNESKFRKILPLLRGGVMDDGISRICLA